jgi:hypothetical protein
MEAAMAYGFVMDVPAPVEAYEAMHAEINRRVTEPVEGMLFHLGRATDRGFQIVEVWDSKEHFQHYDARYVQPVVAELTRGRPMGEVAVQEFEPRGLVVPSAQVLV